MHFILEFPLSGNRASWLAEVPSGCGGWWLATGAGVGGASPDIMDPRPENLNPGISMEEIRGGVGGSRLYGE